MEEKEIIEGNKLIAGFMESVYKGHGYPNIVNFLISPSQFETSNSFEVDELKYHTSWDWLMPVVEKISSMDSGKFSVEIDFPFGVSIKKHNIEPDEELIYGTAEETILQCLYSAVIQFIQWYNQTT